MSCLERCEGLPRRFTLKSPTNIRRDVNEGPADNKRLVKESRSDEEVGGDRNSQCGKSV